MAIPGIIITPKNLIIESATYSVSVLCKEVEIDCFNPVVYQGLKLNTQSYIFLPCRENRIFIMR